MHQTAFLSVFFFFFLAEVILLLAKHICGIDICCSPSQTSFIRMIGRLRAPHAHFIKKRKKNTPIEKLKA